MNNTFDLIAHLSREAKPVAPLRTPNYWTVRLFAVLAVYAAASQFYLGLRPDLWMQLTRPLFALEIALLALLLVFSITACILSMYPDAYQKPQYLKIPYAIFTALSALVTFQLLMPYDSRMVMPELSTHGMECALCIASVALIPSALIFVLLRKGASVRQLQSGSFAVLAASAIGCITIRLAEANDSIMHLVSWHYIPTLVFAALGALIGKHLLKW